MIQEKAWADESELMCWHVDYCSERTVRGINLLNALHYCNGTSIPTGAGILAFGIGLFFLQDYLRRTWDTDTVVVSLGLLALGLYALADGIGIVLWRRERGGVVLLIWAIIGGIVWLVVR